MPAAAPPVPAPIAQGSDRREPAIPHDKIASGIIWPPVGGRMVLGELTAAQIELTCSAGGEWSAIVNGRWRMLSQPDEVYTKLDHGRSVLVQLARACAAPARAGTVDRCVALAPDGHGRYRLWQIERLEEEIVDITGSM